MHALWGNWRACDGFHVMKTFWTQTLIYLFFCSPGGLYWIDTQYASCRKNSVLNLFPPICWESWKNSNGENAPPDLQSLHGGGIESFVCGCLFGGWMVISCVWWRRMEEEKGRFPLHGGGRPDPAGQPGLLFTICLLLLLPLLFTSLIFALLAMVICVVTLTRDFPAWTSHMVSWSEAALALAKP